MKCLTCKKGALATRAEVIPGTREGPQCTAGTGHRTGAKQGPPEQAGQDDQIEMISRDRTKSRF